MTEIFGYNGRLLRVDISTGKIIKESLDEALFKKYLGGASLGIKLISDEVPPGVEWSSPENHLFMGTGPLTGTRISGSGGTAVVSKGPLTNGMTSTQSNGFFGAYLKSSGFDALILQGAAAEWSYLYIHNGVVDIKDARFLLGKDTLEVDSLVKQDLKKGDREVSVMCIGLAGENMVRFACISTDLGHMAAHNGVGAVMGSKNIKAIAVERAKSSVAYQDSESVTRLGKELLNIAMNNIPKPHVEGTIGGVLMGTAFGSLCVRNYTTSINTMDPEVLKTYAFQSIRDRFNAKPSPCWACPAKHCHMMKIQSGKFAGREFEEPEYEGMATFSSLVGIEDVTMSAVLASEVDRLGMDINETGWVIGWLIECYEKKLLTSKDTDGLEMKWGNGESILKMLNKIARRDGFGNLLAEGVMRASQKVGKDAQKLAVHTMKGNTPRSHDHRSVWMELFDTSVSNLGTLEAHSVAPYKLLGIPTPVDTFNPDVVPVVNAKIKGAMVFEDSMVTCRFNTNTNLDLMCQAVNAATGWNLVLQDAMTIGKRAVNVARVFNLRHGIKAELDAPSLRYGSTPLDGIAAGRGILPHWDKMLKTYYQCMGWDEKTGKPLPETLKSLDLEELIPLLG
jgi:aldehyde:ferredoxin oxidoreductase